MPSIDIRNDVLDCKVGLTANQTLNEINFDPVNFDDISD